MHRALAAAMAGVVVLATVTGLGTASALTTDLTLTVDGQTASIRVGRDATVADVLAAQHVEFDATDFVSPSPDMIVHDGDTIEVGHSVAFQAIIDGQAQTVVTTAATLGDALTLLGIDARGSKVSLPPATQITQGVQPVIVITPKMVSLRHDGETLYAETTAQTVADLLAERGIVMGGQDRVTPELTATLTDDMAVVVQRVVVTQETVTVEVPYPTHKTNDPTLPKGQTKVTKPGVKGTATQVVNVVTVDGVEESRTVVSQTLVTKPVAEEMRVGTKPPTVATPPVTPGSAQDIALGLLPEFGFGEDQFGCLVTLWKHESNWRVNAQNKYSGAYGIPQALPGNKMAAFGADWRTNPATQIRWGLNYIKGRYGTPCGAWAHFQAYNWY